MTRFAETRDAAAAQHRERCRAFGGAVHEDAKEDAAMITKGIHQHDAQLHGKTGKSATKVHLRGGGKVEGHKAKHRLDRTHHDKRAEGGAAGGKEKAAGKKGVTVNIILPQSGPAPGSVPVPRPVPVAGARPPMGAPPQAGLGPVPGPGPAPGAMPPPGMGAGAPRPGLPPPGGAAPPMMRARGGKVGHMERVHGVKVNAGSHSGEGRLEKIRMVE